MKFIHFFPTRKKSWELQSVLKRGESKVIKAEKQLALKRAETVLQIGFKDAAVMTAVCCYAGSVCTSVSSCRPGNKGANCRWMAPVCCNSAAAAPLKKVLHEYIYY